MVELFECNGVARVSVAKSSKTKASMGRLTLNIILPVAQSEREVAAEGIRDMVAASPKTAMTMGGVPHFRDRVENRKLVVNWVSTAQVRRILDRFVEIGSYPV